MSEHATNGTTVAWAGTYIFPPRAELALPPSELGSYEGLGWVAQPKLDGNSCLVFLDADGGVRCMDRHASAFSKQPLLLTEGVLAKLRGPLGPGSHVLLGEYMAKSKGDEELP